eukprot:765675-Hanusia_phi.AAC.1
MCSEDLKDHLEGSSALLSSSSSPVTSVLLLSLPLLLLLFSSVSFLRPFSSIPPSSPSAPHSYHRNGGCHLWAGDSSSSSSSSSSFIITIIFIIIINILIIAIPPPHHHRYSSSSSPFSSFRASLVSICSSMFRWRSAGLTHIFPSRSPPTRCKRRARARVEEEEEQEEEGDWLAAGDLLPGQVARGPRLWSDPAEDPRRLRDEGTGRVLTSSPHPLHLLTCTAARVGVRAGP